MNSQKIEVDREFIEQTISDLVNSKEFLCREREAVAAKIEALNLRIINLKEKLVAADRVGSNGKKPRLRKGEGIASILNVLNDLNGLGTSQAQISEKTRIPGSTVYRLLNKNPDKVQVGPDNLWRKK